MLKGQTIEPKVPCPFFGGTKMLLKHSRKWGYFVGCKCNAVGPSAAEPDNAVLAWDHRVQQTSLDQLIMAGGGVGLNDTSAD